MDQKKFNIIYICTMMLSQKYNPSDIFSILPYYTMALSTVSLFLYDTHSTRQLIFTQNKKYEMQPLVAVSVAIITGKFNHIYTFSQYDMGKMQLFKATNSTMIQ